MTPCLPRSARRPSRSRGRGHEQEEKSLPSEAYARAESGDRRRHEARLGSPLRGMRTEAHRASHRHVWTLHIRRSGYGRRKLVSDRYYIGGGIIAMVLGISPFGTPLDAYYAITGERPVDITDEKQQFFEERKEWEPIAFQRFTRKTGLEIVRCNHRYTDRVWPWARAEIDFEFEDGSNGETKTVEVWSAPYWGIAGVDEPPAYITAQAMWG